MTSGERESTLPLFPCFFLTFLLVFYAEDLGCIGANTLENVNRTLHILLDRVSAELEVVEAEVAMCSLDFRIPPLPCVEVEDAAKRKPGNAHSTDEKRGPTLSLCLSRRSYILFRFVSVHMTLYKALHLLGGVELHTKRGRTAFPLIFAHIPKTNTNIPPLFSEII